MKLGPTYLAPRCKPYKNSQKKCIAENIAKVYFPLKTEVDFGTKPMTGI